MRASKTPESVKRRCDNIINSESVFVGKQNWSATLTYHRWASGNNCVITSNVFTRTTAWFSSETHTNTHWHLQRISAPANPDHFLHTEPPIKPLLTPCETQPRGMREKERENGRLAWQHPLKQASQASGSSFNVWPVSSLRPRCVCVRYWCGMPCERRASGGSLLDCD